MWWSCRSMHLEGCIEEQIRNSHLLGSTKWPLKLPGSSFRIARGNFCRQNYTPHAWWFYKSEAWISSEPFSCKKLTEYPCRGCICPVSPVLVTVPGEILKDSSFWPLMSGPASSCDGCVKTFTNSFLLPCKTSKKCIFFF